jgi:hypothetical protein
MPAFHRSVGLLWAVMFCCAIGLAGCDQMKQTPDYWIARAIDSEGANWQIYHDGDWHNVMMDGVRPPSVTRRHIRAADNWFIFAGWVDSVGIVSGRLPICTIEAWNVVPPVRRKVVDFVPADTTGLPWMTVDDFESEVDFQRFTASSVAQFWPKISSLEAPTSR